MSRSLNPYFWNKTIRWFRHNRGKDPVFFLSAGNVRPECLEWVSYYKKYFFQNGYNKLGAYLVVRMGWEKAVEKWKGHPWGVTQPQAEFLKDFFLAQEENKKQR